jgi:hypothetical protein
MLTPRDGLTDPPVLTAIAPPPHAEERDCGRGDEDCTDVPPIDIHGGEPGACLASAHPLIGGRRADDTDLRPDSPQRRFPTPGATHSYGIEGVRMTGA